MIFQRSEKSAMSRIWFVKQLKKNDQNVGRFSDNTTRILAKRSFKKGGEWNKFKQWPRKKSWKSYTHCKYCKSRTRSDFSHDVRRRRSEHYAKLIAHWPGDFQHNDTSRHSSPKQRNNLTHCMCVHQFRLFLGNVLIYSTLLPEDAILETKHVLKLHRCHSSSLRWTLHVNLRPINHLLSCQTRFQARFKINIHESEFRFALKASVHASAVTFHESMQ